MRYGFIGKIVRATIGAVFGVLGGGYLTLAIVVLRAQYGVYLHEFDEVLGWQSAPVLVSALVGGSLGLWSSRRLALAVVYGFVGWGIGAAVGYVIGALTSDRPEGPWAGLAIGAGFGLAAAYVYGALSPAHRPEVPNAAALIDD